MALESKRSKRIRLIALDVDGTLLDDGKGLPEENREALHRASRHGVRVAIATGRMLPSIEPIEAMLGLDCALIAYNGAKVVSTRAEGRTLLIEHPLDAGIAERLIRFSREGGYLLNFYRDEVLYCDDSPERRRFMEIYANRTGARYHPIGLDGFIGLAPTKLILLADPDETDRLLARFRAEFAGKANVTKSDPEYLEFMAPDADKGKAIAVLASHYGIEREEVLAMGDADNDEGLLREAGLGVAVANAREGARRAARRITRRTNNEGAVAEAVERWVLGDERLET
jgi:Cof subfamily protein (haloacid dehalogenase superfamily)